VAESAVPETEAITIEADERVDFKLKFLNGSGQIDPDLSALKARLAVLIKERG